MKDNPQEFQIPYTQTVDDDDLMFVITNVCFGIPLYAFYVFTFDMFEPGEITSLLQSPPIQIEGPFGSLADARLAVMLSCIHASNDSKPG